MRKIDWWARFFRIGIIAKGLDGTLEVVGGSLLLFATPGTLNSLVVSMTNEELSEDPGDFIATRLLHVASAITDRGITFASAYLLVHGAVKVILVIALLRKKYWAYPWMLAMLLSFIAYQCFELAVAPTASLAALTIFDVAVTVLTWHEYRRQKGRLEPMSNKAHRPRPR